MKPKTPYHFRGSISPTEITRYLRGLKSYLATQAVTINQKFRIESEITFFENLKHLATKLKTG